jgi:hypothetical protein
MEPFKATGDKTPDILAVENDIIIKLHQAFFSGSAKIPRRTIISDSGAQNFDDAGRTA